VTQIIYSPNVGYRQFVHEISVVLEITGVRNVNGLRILKFGDELKPRTAKTITDRALAVYGFGHDVF
jgi:hypothetical protein